LLDPGERGSGTGTHTVGLKMPHYARKVEIRFRERECSNHLIAWVNDFMQLAI